MLSPSLPLRDIEGAQQAETTPPREIITETDTQAQERMHECVYVCMYFGTQLSGH